MTKENSLDDYSVDGDVHKILINEEGQYSIWPAGQKAPAGWREIGPTGTKADCVAYVDAHWLDMRPLSLQNVMSGGTS